MQILFLNNLGAGFADTVDVPHGTTVQQFLTLKMGQLQPDQFSIRVNRQPAARDQTLLPGDRVSVTPTKIEGACC